MKIFWISLVVLILSLSLATAESLKPEPLQLTIKSDKQAYKVGEKIKLEITIKNNSDKETIIFWNSKEPEVYSEEIGVYNVAMYVMSQNEPVYIKPKGNAAKILSVTFDKRFRPLCGEVRLVFLYSNIAMPIDFITKPDQEIFAGTLIFNTIIIEVTEQLIAENEAIELAKKACIGRLEVPPDAPVVVELKDKVYIVTFKTQWPKGTLGGDYYARVSVDAASGEVLEILGSD